uniref:Uncharacterized protein n=1 Tax=Sphaerodactylus townsendi TaxID=933632 RepID=A0ACB8G573_9SAUR
MQGNVRFNIQMPPSLNCDKHATREIIRMLINHKTKVMAAAFRHVVSAPVDQVQGEPGPHPQQCGWAMAQKNRLWWEVARPLPPSAQQGCSIWASSTLAVVEPDPSIQQCSKATVFGLLAWAPARQQGSGDVDTKFLLPAALQAWLQHGGHLAHSNVTGLQPGKFGPRALPPAVQQVFGLLVQAPTQQ